MFVRSLSCRDTRSGWTLPPTQFDDFCLFVGLSGAGKSRILQTILNLKTLTEQANRELAGVEWSISFEDNGHEYLWEGRFASLPQPGTPGEDLLIEEFLPEMEEEHLTCDQTSVFSRTQQSDCFRDSCVTGLSRTHSLMELFDMDETINSVRAAFAKVFSIRIQYDKHLMCDRYLMDRLVDHNAKYTSEQIQNSRLPILTKLCWLYTTNNPLFTEIRRDFLEIFPYIDELFFEPTVDGHYIQLCIKERCCSVVHQQDLSEGMFKTLLLLTQLSMLTGHCVVIIDEVENSLGLNCIDILQEQLEQNQNDDQLLVTSHHPYIINSVPMDKWRIVRREGNKVTIQTAEQFGLGRSSHEPYIQLSNALEYSEGK